MTGSVGSGEMIPKSPDVGESLEIRALQNPNIVESFEIRALQNQAGCLPGRKNRRAIDGAGMTDGRARVLS